MNNNKLQSKNFYYCYDLEIYNELKGAGFEYIMKARSIINNKIFTMYEKSDELMELVKKFESSTDKLN